MNSIFDSIRNVNPCFAHASLLPAAEPEPEAELCTAWPTCAEGYCYRQFNGKLNYDAAADVCADYGGRLAAPRTEGQNAAILSVRKNNAFIGISDKDMEGVFTFR